MNKSPDVATRSWYSADEVALMWDVTKQAAYLAAENGRLPAEAIQHGATRHWRFPKTGIDPLDKSKLPTEAVFPKHGRSRPGVTLDESAHHSSDPHEELIQERIGRALAEQRIDFELRENNRLREITRGLIDLVRLAVDSVPEVDDLLRDLGASGG